MRAKLKGAIVLSNEEGEQVSIEQDKRGLYVLTLTNGKTVTHEKLFSILVLAQMNLYREDYKRDEN